MQSNHCSIHRPYDIYIVVYDEVEFFITINFNVFYIIKAMSIRELTWQIKQVVSEAQNFTSILPSLRIFSLKTYEIPDVGQNYNKS